MLIQGQEITIRPAGSNLLAGISFAIPSGAKIGLVGANGCGKTSLCRVITGLQEADGGVLSVQRSVTIGWVPQHLTTPDNCTVLEYLAPEVLARRSELSRLEIAMGNPENSRQELERILRQYGELRESYDEQHGDLCETKAQRILNEIGLPLPLDAKVMQLSGGERNSLALTRALLSNPDVLVLDEPGNHLDFAGLERLERILRDYSGAVLLVSHNRRLLDRCVDRIWQMSNGSLQEYAGNYTDYRMTMLQNAAAQLAQHSVQQAKLQRLEELVRRFEQIARATADPAWGKRLRARRTQLEKNREQAVAAPQVHSGSIDVQIAARGSRADIAIELNNYGKAFDERVLLRDVRFQIQAGERVGLIGPNGSGKTSLIRDLMETGSWENPVMRIGPSFRVGYIAQHREQFRQSAPLLEALQLATGAQEREASSILTRMQFSRRDFETTVSNLSGGEYNRLQLAALLLQGANLLILDEPTNHMDIPSKEIIEEALVESEVTLLVVSHDRYLLDAVVDRLLIIENQGITDFPGRFSEYRSSQLNSDDSLDSRAADQRDAQRRKTEAQAARHIAKGDHKSARKSAAKLR